MAACSKQCVQAGHRLHTSSGSLLLRQQRGTGNSRTSVVDGNPAAVAYGCSDGHGDCAAISDVRGDRLGDLNGLASIHGDCHAATGPICRHSGQYCRRQKRARLQYDVGGRRGVSPV